MRTGGASSDKTIVLTSRQAKVRQKNPAKARYAKLRMLKMLRLGWEEHFDEASGQFDQSR